MTPQQPLAAVPSLLDRRGLLKWSTGGIGAVALAALLQRDGLVCAAAPQTPGEPALRASPAGAALNGPHRKPRVKRVIHIIATGGLSQVDSFDYKPDLAKRHGQSLGG